MACMNAAMKLDLYLKENGLTDAAFGERIGLSQSQVSRIRRGLSWPSKEVIASIASATSNAVTANDIAAETAA